MNITEEQLLELLREAWWHGHRESRYVPNPNGSAKGDARMVLHDFLNPDEE